MTALEYLKAKNDLIERVTGCILIPEDQLVEHEPDLNCTYCTLYYDKCDGCPMKEAGNGCIDNLETSYAKAAKVWGKKATEKDSTELLKLGKRFQREYKGGEKDV
ncbi:MAG: hypothetical protein B5M52_05165 [Helicobacteraceae bacterium 4484_230]|nr:MAG: hypothetical protein B5M52_05165 [Helicobacteraceae bacterium 4484_230]